MCGVFGIVGQADRDIGERVATCIHHRGPDDRGVWVDATGTPVTLANTRLKIIDLSASGHMPMLISDGRVAITYNGEIYNFSQIRAELEQLGHRFRSRSDTEVILRSYAEWGDMCLHHFRGIFAFLIWDGPRQRLFAARDRLGVKPLYWSKTPQGLLLGSELKAMLASGLVKAEMDYQALHHYLTFYAVPPPHTMLEGIQSLLPGHFLTWERGCVSVHQYWDVPTVETQDLLSVSNDTTEIKLELRRLLEESVRLRMVSDVPVGAFLSGGVDSSAIVALMTRLSGERLKTFSIGFQSEGKSIDERSYAKVVADSYDTDHTEVIISGNDVAAELPAFIRAMDQPTGDGLNTYLVSQATSRHVKVALSGLGGDELFAGYRQYQYLQQSEHISLLWRRLPEWVRTSVRAAAYQVARVTGRESIAEIPSWLELEFLARYLRTRTLFGEASKSALYDDGVIERQSGFAPSIDILRAYNLECELDSIVRVTRLELKSYMAHMLLRDTDAMSMAHSLEVRVPLIDHKLVEFATRIPASLKLSKARFGMLGGRTKVILTDTLHDLLPPSIVKRRKQGFNMPLGHWMRGALYPVVDEALSYRSVQGRGLLNPDSVKVLLRDFHSGRGPYMRIWALVVLELWQREFLK